MDEWEARMRKATADPRLPPTVRADFVSALACVDALRNDVHNLNWALGTPGYDQMATPEEQAEADAATARVNDLIARMAANKAAHDAMEKDAALYRWLRDNTHPDNLRKLFNGCTVAIA